MGTAPTTGSKTPPMTEEWSSATTAVSMNTHRNELKSPASACLNRETTEAKSSGSATGGCGTG